MEATVTISLNEYLALKEIKDVLDSKPSYLITEGVFGGYNFTIKSINHNKIVEDLSIKLKKQISINVDLKNGIRKLNAEVAELKNKRSIFNLFKK